MTKKTDFFSNPPASLQQAVVQFYDSIASKETFNSSYASLEYVCMKAGVTAPNRPQARAYAADIEKGIASRPVFDEVGLDETKTPVTDVLFPDDDALTAEDYFSAVQQTIIDTFLKEELERIEAMKVDAPATARRRAAEFFRAQAAKLEAAE